MNVSKRTFTPFLALCVAGISLITALSCSANAIFFSFQTTPAGGASTGDVTAFEGITSGTPTMSIAGTGSANFSNGGASSYTDFQGTTWLGSGGTGNPGSMRWLFDNTGNSFSLNFDATSLEGMLVRFDVYSGGVNPITTFTDLTYDIGGGEVSTGLTLDTYADNATFNEWSIDLSTISAIENQSNLTLKWLIPDIVGTTALRIDNFELTAVPEPSSLTLLALTMGAALLLIRRRKS